MELDLIFDFIDAVIAKDYEKAERIALEYEQGEQIAMVLGDGRIDT